MVAAIEEIPNEDPVSRHIDYPHMFNEQEGLIWKNVFLFQDGRPESLVWRKYAPTIEDVHSLGCQRQVIAIARKPGWRYKGAITATTGQIRQLRNRNGHGFSVIHEPGEGIHHAHVVRRPAVEGQNIPQSERLELREMIYRLFGPVEPHDCPAG